MNCTEFVNHATIGSLIIALSSLIFAIYSSRKTSKQLERQIKTVKKISHLHLVTAMNANQKLMLETEDSLNIKKTALAKGTPVMNESRETMEMNIKRLEKILQNCHNTQKEYEELLANEYKTSK